MSIALFAHPGVFAPLQNLFRWLTSGLSLTPPDELNGNFSRRSGHGKSNESRNRQIDAARSGSCGFITAHGSNHLGIGHSQTPYAPELIANYDRSTGTNAVKGTQSALNKPPRTLRIVRLFEANQAPASVGQMAMSGRMADVCAELDRLAARETAH